MALMDLDGMQGKRSIKGKEKKLQRKAVEPFSSVKSISQKDTTLSLKVMSGRSSALAGERESDRGEEGDWSDSSSCV